MANLEKYENLVLGSGGAGKFVGWTMAEAGRRTAMVERAALGGACPNVACLPSKNIVYSVKVISLARRGAEFGPQTESMRVDTEIVQRQMVEGLHQKHLDRTIASGVESIMGNPRFVAPRTVEIDLNRGGQRTIFADRVFLDLGSRAAIPEIPGLAAAKPMTHVELLDLDRVPEHLITGQGPIEERAHISVNPYLPDALNVQITEQEIAMNELTGKVAIVTGASKGIGAALANALAAAGAAVAVNYSAGKEGADRIVSDIVRQGGKAVSIQADVSKATDVKRLFEETRRAFGSVDVLVNNAGVFQFDPIEAVTEKEFHRHFDINVLGTFLATQEAIKYFPRRGGSIINISSIASENPVPNSSLYASTKGAIDTLTMALSKELGPRNIRVNAVAPGLVDTEGNRTSGLVESPAGTAGAAATPLGGRFGRPADIAPVVVFLASDDSAWLTGERITASGGLH